ncbi:MAG: MoaD/ThiS family protein [Flavobacteriales bacterium]|nr:MoaD/ThiS family protein [Flavobacteriales bacterium]
MKIKILAFGISREIVGNREVYLDFEEEISVTQLRIELFRRYPKLSELGELFIAQNCSYTQGYELVSAEDEIALIPPVSGG